MTVAWQDIVLEEGPLEKTPCDCCGQTTFTVEGNLLHDDNWLAFYTVRFNPKHLDAYPVFTIGTGDWSDTADASNRWFFGAEYNAVSEGFRLIDLKTEDTQKAYVPLNRDDIIGSPFAPEAFAMLDAIFMGDARLKDIHNEPH